MFSLYQGMIILVLQEESLLKNARWKPSQVELYKSLMLTHLNKPTPKSMSTMKEWKWIKTCWLQRKLPNQCDRIYAYFIFSASQLSNIKQLPAFKHQWMDLSFCFLLCTIQVWRTSKVFLFFVSSSKRTKLFVSVLHFSLTIILSLLGGQSKASKCRLQFNSTPSHYQNDAFNFFSQRKMEFTEWTHRQILKILIMIVFLTNWRSNY